MFTGTGWGLHAAKKETVGFLLTERQLKLYAHNRVRRAFLDIRVITYQMFPLAHLHGIHSPRKTDFSFDGTNHPEVAFERYGIMPELSAYFRLTEIALCFALSGVATPPDIKRNILTSMICDSMPALVFRSLGGVPGRYAVVFYLIGLLWESVWL